MSISGERGIRTPGPVTVNGFQDHRIRPLCHLSLTGRKCKNILHPTKFNLSRLSLYNILGFMINGVRFFFAAIALFASQVVYGQDFNVNVFYSQFLQANGEPYIEVYFALDPNTVALAQNNRQQWQGNVEVLITVKKEDKIVAIDKFQMLTPEMNDTTLWHPFVFQQSRLALSQGEFEIFIEMKDVHSAKAPVTIRHPFKVEFLENRIAASSMLILDSYKESNAKDAHVKYGVEMIPIVPAGTYFIPEKVSSLPFYIELYNTNHVIGEESGYVLKFFIRDNLAKKTLNNFTGYKKAKGSKVQPLLNEFNITELKTGYYEVVVEVVNSQNEIVETFSTPFYRRNGQADYASIDLREVKIANTFVEGMRSPDTLVAYIECLYPISTEAERRIASNLLVEKKLEVMQSYFFNFWKQREPSDPNASWQTYLADVKKVNSMFGSQSIPGYKTEMGRVYLQYGKPTLIERSDHDPSNYPWQIWQYDVLQSAATPTQNNQLFVFVDQALTGRTFQLIHSTALGEIRDDKWQFQLNRHTNRGPDVDAQSTQMGRDNFGYRVNNNFIIGDQRFWFDRQ